MVLPAEIVFASREYEIDEPAVAVYVTVPAPLHLVEVDPDVNTGDATTGVIVTVCIAVVGP